MKRNCLLSMTMRWLILGIVFASASLGKPATPQATLKAVAVSGPASRSELVLRIEGGYSFRTFQAAEDIIFVDLKGVKVGRVSPHAEWSGGLVQGYRLLPFTDASGQSVVRVQVEMKHREPFTVRQDGAGLRMLFGQNSAATSASGTLDSPRPAAAPRAVAAGAVPAIPSRGSVEVTGISIKAGTTGETFVDVSTTRPTHYRVLRLKDPARLVVDFEGARHSGHQRTYPAQSPVLKGVRVGQFSERGPGVARVVADLVGDPILDVHAQPGGVRIDLKSRALTSLPALPKEKSTAVVLPAVGVKAEPVPSVTTPETRVIPAEPVRSQVQVPAAGLVAPKALATQPAPAVSVPMDYQNALPVATGSKEVAAPRPQPPEPTPGALRASKAAKTLAGDSELVPDATQAQAPAGAGAAEEKPKYTGEPISLNLKDVDLKDFFRLIHEISGLNIIVDPNVSGSVTLVLDAVPWDQALDIVLKNNRLSKTLEGNVLRIAKVETLSAEQEEVTKLAAAREEAQPLVTRFRPVNYAKASTIAALLKGWTGGGALTKRGNILVDERTNTLIISDIQSQAPIIESIITKLDKKAKQVQIEARIVEATADFSRNFQSVITEISAPQKVDRLHIDSQSGTGASASPVNSLTSSGPVIALTNTTASGFGVVAVSSASARFVINAALAALESRDQLKTISRPSIVTQNNVPGTITQGTQIPVTTSINLTVTTTYVDAALTLTVTPQVTEDGNIFMNIIVKNATPGPQIPFNPNLPIITEQASTNVLVPDGGTVVFGGVTKTRRSKSAQQVPLLGSIPVIGHLFKASTVSDSDVELLFFVSPKVLPV